MLIGLRDVLVVVLALGVSVGALALAMRAWPLTGVAEGGVELPRVAGVSVQVQGKEDVVLIIATLGVGVALVASKVHVLAILALGGLGGGAVPGVVALLVALEAGDVRRVGGGP